MNVTQKLGRRRNLYWLSTFGEVALCAMTKLAVQISGVISMSRNFGVGFTGVVKSDSSTAIGTAHSDELGGADTSRCNTCGSTIQDKGRSAPDGGSTWNQQVD